MFPFEAQSEGSNYRFKSLPGYFERGGLLICQSDTQNDRRSKLTKQLLAQAVINICPVVLAFQV